MSFFLLADQHTFFSTVPLLFAALQSVRCLRRSVLDLQCFLYIGLLQSLAVKVGLRFGCTKVTQFDSVWCNSCSKDQRAYLWLTTVAQRSASFCIANNS
ncbi:hypothetical protein PSPO01_05760 [Paraphaeosphaeria sporulosa]